MSESMVKLITCDGPKCSVECSGIVVGWIMFAGSPDRHLCPDCSTEENIKHQIYYQEMQQIDKERGD